MLQLSPEQEQRGIITHSSGNHAQAIALAGKVALASLLPPPLTSLQMKGLKTWIVIPASAPAPKLAAVRGYGAEVVHSGTATTDRERVCAELQAQTGAHFISPFNDARVIAGQGTLALELLEDVPDLDCILVPISGGGLLAGVALGAAGAKPGIRVFGAEPVGAADAHASFHKGEIVHQEKIETICDGLRSQHVGTLTFPIIQQHVEDILLASDDEVKVRLLLSSAPSPPLLPSSTPCSSSGSA